MLEMTKNLDCIPYDVFYQVASTLDCHDFIHLSRVNRSLNALMRNESLARKTVENHLLHTKEGQQASENKSGYRHALGRLYDIKEAVATADPYSASIIGYGSAFLYSGGALCYVFNDEIRALDVHGASQVEHVLNLHAVLSRVIPGCDPTEDATQLSLMNYSHGVLAIAVDIVERRETWLLAVDMRRKTEGGKGRLRLRRQLENKQRLFVRHNQSYLYYGTHSGAGYHGYKQWIVNCVELATGKQTNETPVQLHNFAGNEIGQTVCFDIHQDHLYAVSTQASFEMEEVDWTSFYVWVCVAPTDNTKRVTLNRTWRRQHREGPINDSWSDISLRHDEATQQLIILECRREWHKGGSENIRTYYVQPLPSPSEIIHSKHQGEAFRPVSLPDEPLTKTLDSSSKPNYERPRKRLRRHYHPEYPLGGGDDPVPRRDFILNRTKLRTYNLCASTFIDLVNDPCPTPGSLIPHDRLRLRMVSRKRKCPIDEAGEEGPPNRLYRPEITEDDQDGDGPPADGSDERFASRGIRLWPPDNAPPELAQLLCPSKRTGKVEAMADERTIIYTVNQEGLRSDLQAIILINFDPALRLPGLRRLDMSGTPETQPTGTEQPQIPPMFNPPTRAGRTTRSHLSGRNGRCTCTSNVDTGSDR
ncbi:F-box domain protein [Aspergillus nomiae NRRL 13137]|uniref:F-box domain protein n=1 Tax=Aspergillus nomiae NRRL (strain ATCC 15546 / NRRL 13137 / CBS 260.88 / M93) TaxID=1509407 RepID=A0A0L1IQ04_ASPN3|nr:F-box domain protein [Aspergillus nomiae NRRL 13137]KNG81328.1 F-box domain protein [Aspergillus nomiae NRRL 13137]